jgi:Ca-activated chloride channel family protein
VNKPLLEQLASDSGGLAAFLSPEDNVSRQAKAFRRKLTRPVATDLKIDFAGLEVTDLEPKTMPNLYFGAPVRVYGRYKGSGKADVSVRGSVNGLEFKQGAKLEFPREDLQNTEIERMWAWKRIDGLLKEADRTGARGRDTIDEVVRLGEGYSIVTEYTSFLVLENDAEFQRWKIARNNVLRTDRDRQAQQVVRAQFDSMRNKAMADLGPQADRKELAMAQPVTPSARSWPSPQAAPAPQQQNPAPSARPAEQPRNSGQGFNLNPGSGPVGPLGVVMLAVASRLKRKRTQA